MIDRATILLLNRLEDACKHRNIADCEFFINKRDYPHLKVRGVLVLMETLSAMSNRRRDLVLLLQENLSEPYGFLFDKDDRNPADDIPLTSHKYATYAPIMSFYISKRYVSRSSD